MELKAVSGNENFHHAVRQLNFHLNQAFMAPGVDMERPSDALARMR